jgi:hypothetical protein
VIAVGGDSFLGTEMEMEMAGKGDGDWMGIAARIVVPVIAMNTAIHFCCDAYIYLYISTCSIIIFIVRSRTYQLRR